MPKGIPLTEEQQAKRRREVFDAAASLFLEQGFAETSMREIADAAGIGKSTLYGYFRTKDDVLVFVVEEEVAALNRRASEIAGQQGRAADRLERLLRMHLDTLVANKSYFLQLTTEVQRLHADSLGRIQAQRHAYQDLILELVEEGIREGSFRPVNAVVAAKILLALMMPVVWTTRPVGTPQEMLADALDICYRGLCS
jgi:AcrR family transcriptional regulator